MAASVRLCVLSLSARSPEGDDAAYLEWHSLDHLPEQYALRSLMHGQRWVSTPACRSARAAGDEAFDATDHAVQYLFADKGSLDGFFALGAELREAGRMPLRLPPVELAAYALVDTRARLVRPEVLPWRPNRGAYLIVSDQPVDVDSGIDGIAGVWRYRGGAFHERFADTTGRHLTVCYLDADPAEVGAAITASLPAVRFGAPFVSLSLFDWERSLP